MTGTKKSFDEAIEKTRNDDEQEEDNTSAHGGEGEDDENQRRTERLQRLLFSLEETIALDQAHLEDQDIEQLAGLFRRIPRETQQRLAGRVNLGTRPQSLSPPLPFTADWENIPSRPGTPSEVNWAQQGPLTSTYPFQMQGTASLLPYRPLPSPPLMSFKKKPEANLRPSIRVTADTTDDETALYQFLQNLLSLTQAAAQHSAEDTQDLRLKDRLSRTHNKLVDFLDYKNRILPIKQKEDSRIARNTLNLTLDILHHNRLRQRKTYRFYPMDLDGYKKTEVDKDVEACKREIRYTIGTTKKTTLGPEVTDIISEICKFNGRMRDEDALMCLSSAYTKEGQDEIQAYLSNAYTFDELVQELVRLFSDENTVGQQQQAAYKFRLDYKNIKLSLQQVHREMTKVNHGLKPPAQITDEVITMTLSKLPSEILPEILEWIELERYRGVQIPYPEYANEVERLMTKHSYPGKKDSASTSKSKQHIRQAKEDVEHTINQVEGDFKSPAPLDSTKKKERTNLQAGRQKARGSPKDSHQEDSTAQVKLLREVEDLRKQINQLTARNLMTGEQKTYPPPLKTHHSLPVVPRPLPPDTSSNSFPQTSGSSNRDQPTTFRARLVLYTDPVLYVQAQRYCIQQSQGDIARCFQAKADNMAKRGRGSVTLKTVSDPNVPIDYTLTPEGRYYPSSEGFYRPVYIEYAPAKFSLTDEITVACSQRCYRCFEPTCGSNANNCIYAKRSLTFSFCSRCRRGFHDEAECMSTKTDIHPSRDPKPQPQHG